VQAEVVMGGFGIPRPATTQLAGPWSSRCGAGFLGGLEPTKDLCFTSQGYVAGMAFLTGVPASEGRHTDSPGMALLRAPPCVNTSTILPRVHASEEWPRSYVDVNLLVCTLMLPAVS
jgi:hypothetical protein